MKLKYFQTALFLCIITTFSAAQDGFEIKTHQPGRNAQNIPTSTAIEIEFTNSVNVDNLPARSIVVFGDIAGEYFGEVIFGQQNERLRFQADAPFREGESIQVTLNTQILDVNKKALEKPCSFTFTIASFPSNMVYNHVKSISLVNIPYPVNVYSYDLNKDSRLDFVVGGSSDISGEKETKLSILRARRDSALLDFFIEEKHAGATTCCLFLASFDGDAFADIIALDVITENLTFLRGNENSFDNARKLIDVPRPYHGDFADYDGDGNFDFAIGSSRGVFLFTNSGGASFEMQPIDTTTFVRTAAWADVNNDGVIDLLAMKANGAEFTLSVFPGNGAGELNEPVISQMLEYSTFIQLHDFDFDGDLDLAAVQPFFRRTFLERGNVEVLFNDGEGNFTHNQSLNPEGIYPALLDCADLDGDGDIDIICTNGGSDSNRDSTMTIFLNDGFGQFSFSRKIVVDTLPKGIRCVDLNDDGRMDLVVATAIPAGIHFFLADQTSSIPSTPLPDKISLLTYPNPFRDRLSIQLESPQAARGEFMVFDLMGRQVFSRKLQLHSGTNNYAWNGADLQGRALPSGIYWARFLSDSESVSRKIVLLR